MKINSVKFDKLAIKSMILTFLTVSFILLDMAMNMYVQLNNNLFLGVGFFIALIAFLFAFYGNKYTPKYIVITSYILVVTGFISSLYTNNYSLLRVFYITQGILLAIALSKFNLNFKILRLLTYGLLIFFFYHIILRNDPNEVFLLVSRNGLTLHLLIILSLYTISLVQNNCRVDYLAIFLSFIVSIWTLSRSGVLSFLVFFIVSLFNLVGKKQKKSQRRAFLLVLIVVLFMIIFIRGLSETYILNSFINRLENESINNIRIEMLIQYLTHILNNIGDFLFGGRFSDIGIIRAYNNNPHNSYIHLHSQFGIFGSIMIFFLLILSLFSNLKSKNYIILAIFGAIILRISTDTFAFSGVFDFLIYYLIIITVSKNDLIRVKL
jgi:hypothetical protein